MEIRNRWTSYLTRSFEQIKLSVIKRLSVVVPEMKDFSQSNLLILLVDIYAGVAEMLNYYIDAIARELFPTTALRLSSMVKIARQQGYWGTAAVPASADLVVELLDTNDEPLAALVDLVIPIGTQFKDKTGNYWASIAKASIKTGTSKVLVLARQYEVVGPFLLANSDGNPWQTYKLGSDYAHGSLYLTVDGVVWDLVDTVSLHLGTSKVYMVALDVDGFMYVMFGDNVTGAIPDSGKAIVITQQSTLGYAGNVPAGAIDAIMSSIVVPPTTSLSVVNHASIKDGRDIDDVQSLSITIPKAVYTLGRAVTKKDFEYIAEMSPGIREAIVSYVCGGQLEIYVAPFTTAIASQSQLLITKQFVEARANITVGEILIKSAGETLLNIELDIKTFPNAIQTAVLEEVRLAMLYSYNVDVQNINGIVKLSDIYTLVDTLNNIDYVNIEKLSAQPFLRAVGTDYILDCTFEIDKGYISTGDYKVVYSKPTNQYHVLQGSQQVVVVDVNTPTVIVPGLTITIADDTLVPDNKTWLFKTYSEGTNLFVKDGTIPMLTIDNLIINFI